MAAPLAPIALESLLDCHADELKSIAESASKGDRARVVEATVSLVTTLATSHPAIGALVPFARMAVAAACGNAADAMLRRELAAMETEEQRQSFLGQIDAVVAALLGQAMIQLVSVQHAIKDELKSEAAAALGGLQADFEQFRRDFAANLESDDPTQHLIERQLVEDGALGVRLLPRTMNRIKITFQRVRGTGSVGIEL